MEQKDELPVETWQACVTANDGLAKVGPWSAHGQRVQARLPPCSVSQCHEPQGCIAARRQSRSEGLGPLSPYVSGRVDAAEMASSQAPQLGEASPVQDSVASAGDHGGQAGSWLVAGG